jgi:hypothetical protein
MTTTTTTKPVTFKGILGVKPLLSYVDPAPGAANSDRVPESCWRCDGTGYTCFKWVANGVCFHCGGTGTHYAAAVTVRKRAKADAYYRDYEAEIQAYWAERNAAEQAAAKAAEFAAAWDEAHAEQARRAALVNGFLGEVGDKITVTGTVQVAKYISGSWNRSSSVFLVVKADTGHIVKTFSSSQSVFALDRGDQVELTGAVKAHEAYNGQDQTVLIRVKAVITAKVGDDD